MIDFDYEFTQLQNALKEVDKDKAKTIARAVRNIVSYLMDMNKKTTTEAKELIDKYSDALDKVESSGITLLHHAEAILRKEQHV